MWLVGTVMAAAVVGTVLRGRVRRAWRKESWRGMRRRETSVREPYEEHRFGARSGGMAAEEGAVEA